MSAAAIRVVALVLTILTGASGLVYEVAWQRYLATLLGSHSEATAALLGIFLLGLSLGYSLFGRVTRAAVARAARAGRPPRLLVLYGVVEAAIGVYAFVFPWLFQLVQRLSFALPHASPGVGFALDVVLCALLVLPPTILMGGTIPILTQALSRSLEDATRFHALVYAFNTAGAFAGALAAGWTLIPTFGLSTVMIGVSVANLFAGAVFVVLGRGSTSALRPVDAVAGAPAVAGAGLFLTVALLGGFAMMALQTVVIRVGGLSLGASGFTFSTVVAVFVLCIAIGSLAVSLLPRIRPGYVAASQWALVVILLALYRPIGDAPYWLFILRSWFRDHVDAFYPFFTTSFVATLLAIAPAVILSGALLPLLFHALRRESGELGAMAGSLYSWNTVGSLLGALLGGYVFLSWMDLDGVYRISVAAVALSALLLTHRLLRASVPALAACALAAAAAILLIGPWDQRMMTAGLFRLREPSPLPHSGPTDLVRRFFEIDRIVFYDDDSTASVAVTERDLPGRGVERRIVTNGKVDGATYADYPTMALAGIVPAMLADDPQRAFVIGFGTGITAGALAGLQSIREVEVAEISSGVLAAAPLFDFANGDVTRSPKVRLLRSDAYRALRRSEGQFDVIVSEPSNPWVSGVEMLFSEEFLTAARDRLRPGGVYCQWYHQYETNDQVIELVLRTYASVFDRVAVWYGVGTDLLILGMREERPPDENLARLENRFAQPDYRVALRRSEIRSLPELLAHELVPFGAIHALELRGPIHTLFHPRLSHDAGIAFFVGAAGSLPFVGNGEAGVVAHRNSLLAQLASRFGGDLPDEERALVAQSLCRRRAPECTALLADWYRVRPDSAALAKAMHETEARGTTDWGVVQLALVPKLAKALAAQSSPSREAIQLRRVYYHPALSAGGAGTASAVPAQAAR